GGIVDALIMLGVNPVYTLPNGKEFGEAVEKLPLSVSFSMYADESSSKCGFICPTHHYMESWNEYMPKDNSFALAQPVIRPLFDTQQWQETLAIWAGLTDRGLTEKDRKDSTYYHDLIKTAWVDYFNANSDQFAKYDDAHTFWNYMVHNGGGWMSAKKAKPASMNGGVVSKAASA